MKKITIQHYLNKKLKHSVRNGITEYSVYVRVSYGRKNERIKSDWIMHPCSEYDFENNKQILELKQYESDIITDILKNNDNEKFNLSARLQHSQCSVTDIFIDYMFDKYEIKEQLISFISSKAEISSSILNPYFRDDYLRSNEWKELGDKDIFKKATRQKVIYLAMLMEFEEDNYPPLPDEVFGLKAGCIFVSYEWNNKNKKSEFLDFAEKKKNLSKKDLTEITKTFDIAIHKQGVFDFRFA